MKKFLFSLLLLLSTFSLLAQDLNYVTPTEIEPHWGFVRKAFCNIGDAGTCTGDNPPTVHLTPSMCGLLFSASGAKNQSDGSLSTEGVRYTLPLASELSAAGYNGSGNFQSSGFEDRRGQCTFSFVIALPIGTYIRIGIDGVQGTDKVTFVYEGTFHDLHNGDVVITGNGSAILTIGWNGNSWVALAGAPSLMEQLGYGQTWSQGQGRLFVVTADPTWWTATSRIGKLAYCPVNGRGLVVPDNDGYSLGIMPAYCSFLDSASGSILYLIGIRNFKSFNVTGISAGAAYLAGTAPNGETYSAGNYIVLTASTTGFVDGDTIRVHNLKTTNGARINGSWIGELVDSTHIELHERVREWTDTGSAPVSNIGPPSSFIAGDTLDSSLTPPIVAGGYNALQAVSMSGGAGRYTHPISGVELDAGLALRSVVGIVRTVGSAFVDTATQRYVSSFFNPYEKVATCVFTADRTTASAAFVELNSEIRCNFVHQQRSSYYAVGTLGDNGDSVRYSANITASNNTSSDGCEFAVAFDGTTAEQASPPGFTNPAGENSYKQNVNVSGLKTGLSELTNNPHYMTLLARATGGGTCTVYSTGTTINVYVRQ